MLQSRVLTFTLLCAATAFASVAFAQEPLRIGAINPYSGPLALYGDELARGYQLAVDERNAKGGVLGRKIELVKGDAANPQQGIAAIDQLATRDKVDLFIGTYISAVSNAASDAAQRYNKLYWDTNAVAAELTERGLPNFVRVGPNAQNFADMSVRAIVEMIAPALNKQPKDLVVWIEHEDSIYGKSIADIQKKLLEQKGVKVAGEGSHNFKAADLTDAVLRAKRANPDVWLQTGYVPDDNLLLKTARAGLQAAGDRAGGHRRHAGDARRGRRGVPGGRLRGLLSAARHLGAVRSGCRRLPRGVPQGVQP